MDSGLQYDNSEDVTQPTDSSNFDTLKNAECHNLLIESHELNGSIVKDVEGKIIHILSDQFTILSLDSLLQSHATRSASNIILISD